MSDVRIQRLDGRHAAQYRALSLEAYARHPQAFASSIGNRGAIPLAWWAARLDDEWDVQLGAFQGEVLVGIVGLALELEAHARHKATLFGLYVSQAWRQGGVGYQLVQGVLAEAREQPQVRLIQLTVTAGSDAAIALYRRCGFMQSGLESLAVRVGDDYFDKIHMCREAREL